MNNNVNEIVRRNYEFTVRAEKTEKNEGILLGRPIVYNSVTDIGYFDEVIERGALDEADLSDVCFLVNHDTSKIPLARSRQDNADSTMQLSIDTEGMPIKVMLDIVRNTDAVNLYSAVERGDVSGMSFMFSIKEQRWENMDTDHPLRRILKISKVIEVSAVTFPAYKETDISARNKDALESARRDFEKAKNDLQKNEKRSYINPLVIMYGKRGN